MLELNVTLTLAKQLPLAGQPRKHASSGWANFLTGETTVGSEI